MALEQRVLSRYPRLMSLGERIRQARRDARLSQAKLAERIKVGQTTIAKWEADKSEPSREEVRRIAAATNVSVYVLETGDSVEQPRQIRLMGHVGAGGAVHPLDDDFPLDFIEAPPTAPDGAEAAIVRGDSMLPTFRDGNVLIWWTWSADPYQFIGLPCVCRLHDGSVVVKIVEQGSRRGVWMLTSLNASTPPMRDVRVQGVAPVEITLRRVHWRI